LTRAEADFEHVPEGALAVELDATAEVSGVIGGEGHAGVNGGFVVGRGFRFDHAAEQPQEGWLLTTSPGEDGAHGNGRS
jgi:hypothetical protein